MSLPSDPVILFSYINTLLRDEYSSLDDLCKSLSVSKEEITEKLSSAGFYYSEDSNCFR